jgi:YidC/Oxa1 family membrane protein insertase
MGLLVLSWMMYIQWQKDYGSEGKAPVAAAETSFESSGIPAPQVGNSTNQATSSGGDLPSPDAAIAADQAGANPVETTTPQAQMSAGGELVVVTTDVLEVQIDLLGGTLVSAKLLNYPVTLKVPAVKVNLLSPSGPEMFIAQSGLLSRDQAPNHTSTYQSAQSEYALQANAEEIRIPLTWQSENGIKVTKTFIFKRGEYDVTVRHTLTNGSGQDWNGSRYDQLQRSVVMDKDDGGFTNPGRYSFFGIAFYSPDEKLEKIDFDDVASEPYQRAFSGGWLAVIQHYFFTAWIPPHDQVNSYSTQVYSPEGFPRYIARDVSPSVRVASGANHEFNSRIYVGPKLQDTLDDVAPGLNHTVDYGIFTVFSKPLFWIMSKIHSVVNNWGWSIVLLTVLIKLVFFKLTEAQYRSMARMRKLQPRIEQLKERYGDDRQKMSQAMMEMYKTEKVNPLGGCLPILVQIPIFIALYWVLLESVELRQAPFILWIENLSVRDPYFILPLLNAAFMMMTQRLTPMAGMDPMQRKIMQFMPVGFSIMFAFFPAGLVLYWATNAGLSLAQQWYITRKIDAAD